MLGRYGVRMWPGVGSGCGRWLTV